MEAPDLTSGDLYVSNAYLIRSGAGRAERSPDGALISFHQKGSDDYYDCYVMDTAAQNATCLTCHFPAFANRHTGQPSWHPSGNFIAFQAEKAEYYRDENPVLAHPGIGFSNDVYVMTADG